MDWIKLVDLKEPWISRGSVFRFPAKWPYEEIVEFMVVNIPCQDKRHTIVVSSGQKAGFVRIMLPLEAELKEGIAISREWLVENWNKWVYQDSSVDEVLYKRRYLVEQ